MVGVASPRGSWSGLFRHLLTLVRLHQFRLQLGPLHLADLLALHPDRRTSDLPGASRHLGSGGAASNVLLLPQGLLPSVLLGSARVRATRGTRGGLSWRDRLSFRFEQFPSLLPV